MRFLKKIYDVLVTVWEHIVNFVREVGWTIILAGSLTYLVIAIISASRSAGAASCI